MEKILLGKGKEKVYINSNMLNRHGLISGATGTGKTVTLKIISEELSKMGVPCFIQDVKGDLSSLAEEIEVNEKISERVQAIGIEDYLAESFPIELWDLFQEEGIPVRTTISEMGPLMLTRLLGLNETQEGILNIAFKIADEQGLLLIDIKDLKAVLNFISDNSKELQKEYGNISSQSVGAIIRSILVLENEGAKIFFQEPALDIKDFMRQDSNGRGIINILSSKRLFNSPRLYSTFLLWMLSEVYENLEEVGDLEKPKFVFFFDEAHLIFKDAPKALIEKIEMIVRLIRSKGVGVFFITQNPLDIPESVLGQLSNKIQHALRAYTPKEIKNIKSIAESYRQEEGEDLAKIIQNLQVGEAIVSSLDEQAIPTIAEKTLICPPRSSFKSLDPMKLRQIINSSSLLNKYQEEIDRESAYEIIENKKREMEIIKLEEKERLELEKREAELRKKEEALIKKQAKSYSRRSDSHLDRLTKNIFSSVGREIGRSLFRGIFGNLKK